MQAGYLTFPKILSDTMAGLVIINGFNFSNDLDIPRTTVDKNGTLDGRLNVVNLGVSRVKV